VPGNHALRQLVGAHRRELTGELAAGATFRYSGAVRVSFCESCGAPLDAAWNEIVVVCRFCAAHSLPNAPGAPVPLVHPDDGRPRLSVDGRTYLVEQTLAEGESSVVFRGRWVVRLGELVVLKVQRALSDTDLLRREHDLLVRLHRAPAHGAERLLARVPAPIALGPLRDPFAGRRAADGTEGSGPLTRSARDARLVAVHGWKAGFVHTLADVAAAHPSGVPPAVAVWLLKRLLEVLTFLHQSGVCHNAIVPRHVLVHARDHGAILVGYSLAGPIGARVDGAVEGDEALRPEAFVRDPRGAPRWDLAMAAASVATVWSPVGPVGDLMAALRAGEHGDAWTARAELDRAAALALGPPRYHPLAMPGWPHP
jgi:hypothetical protein